MNQGLVCQTTEMMVNDVLQYRLSPQGASKSGLLCFQLEQEPTLPKLQWTATTNEGFAPADHKRLCVR